MILIYTAYKYTHRYIYIYIYYAHSLNTSSRDGGNHFWLPGTWHPMARPVHPHHQRPGCHRFGLFPTLSLHGGARCPDHDQNRYPVNQLGEPTCITCIATCLSVKTCRFSPPDRATRAKLWATCRKAVSWFSGDHLCRPVWEDM